MAYSSIKDSGKKRKYNDNYIQYGFTTILEKGCEHPQCVVCFKVLSEHSMKPSLLKRHLSGCHPELLDRDVEFFTQKEIGLKRVRLDKSGNVNKQNQAALRASYMVALRIAKEKFPHTIAEKFILPCCKDIVRCLIGDVDENNLNCVPLSNDTVQRRIYDIADDIEQQVVAEIRGAPLNKFAIQLDESTDVASCAQLLVFARYIKDGDFKKNSCFAIVWNPLRGERMFSMKFLNIFGKGDFLGIMLVRALLMVLLPCLEIALDFGHE